VTGARDDIQKPPVNKISDIDRHFRTVFVAAAVNSKRSSRLSSLPHRVLQCRSLDAQRKVRALCHTN
jgi:hypothetical protein